MSELVNEVYYCLQGWYYSGYDSNHMELFLILWYSQFLEWTVTLLSVIESNYGLRRDLRNNQEYVYYALSGEK